MVDGVIAGGWEYVIAAYGITAVVLSGYWLSLTLKLRNGRNEDSES